MSFLSVMAEHRGDAEDPSNVEERSPSATHADNMRMTSSTIYILCQVDHNIVSWPILDRICLERRHGIAVVNGENESCHTGVGMHL